MKFDHDSDAYIYGIAIESADQLGSAPEHPLGWAARVEMDSLYDQDRDAMKRYDGADLFVVRENSDGIVTIRPFHTQAEHERAWALLEQGFAQIDAGVEDQELRDAIDGYLQAAQFTGLDEQGESLDGRELSWTLGAQDKARADVIGFVTQNIAEVREFLAVTGHDFTQIGIDFSLTRNRNGAGFWSRGAGEPGKALTEAAHAWGEATVFVNEQSEMDFA